MKEILTKNKFYVDNKVYQWDDFYSESFVDAFVDSQIISINCEIENEVFYSVYQQYLSLKLHFEHLNIDTLLIKSDSDWDRLHKAIILDVSKKKGIKVKGANIFKVLITLVFVPYSLVIIFSTYIYFLWKLLKLKSTTYSDKSSNIKLIRTPAAMKKMEFLTDIDIAYETLDKNDSFYSRISRFGRLKIYLKSIYYSFSYLVSYFKYVRKGYGLYVSMDRCIYYSKRVFHTRLYQNTLEKIFSKNQYTIMYTGNCLDRFAYIENMVSSMYKIKDICIPHGMEFGYKFPLGYLCDIHYCTTKTASSVLNELYETNKFIYDESIASKMLKIQSKGVEELLIVFFTEPREISVNIEIIQELIVLAKELNLKVYIKLHPKDSVSNYEEFKSELNVLNDFGVSISSNICLSRKSTVLVEAIHNNSKAISILINEKDKILAELFPSLHDDNINTIYKLENLKNIIVKNKR